MKKILRFSFAIVLFLFAVTGCKNDSVKEVKLNSNKSDTKKIIKLKWLGQWYGEGKKETFVRELAREFSFQNQNIQVELEFPHQMAKTDVNGAFAATIDTITNMVLQNKWPYDFMLCDSYIYNGVSSRVKNPNWGDEYLVNFIDKKWFLEGHKENLFKSRQYTDIFSGIAPGAYIEGVWNLLYVSSEVENKLGIKVKLHDMNMSDFSSYAKAVFQYNQSHKEKITFFTSPVIPSTTFFNQLIMSAFNKDTIYTKEKAINALKQEYDVVDELVKYKPMEKYFTYKDSKALYQDKGLFVYCASWIYLIWQHSNPEGVKVMHPCEIPSIDNKQANTYSGVYSSIFVIPKNAKNKEAAELLMKFICSQETAEKWTKYAKSPTGLSNRISYSDFGKDEFAKFDQHIKKKYNDKLGDADQIAIIFNSKAPLNYQFETVLYGATSAKNAFDALLKQVNAK